MHRALERIGAAIFPSPARARRRAVLCYHSVDPAPGPVGLRPELFDVHLDWLGAHCRVVPLAELVARGDDAGGPYVALTFDDGYADNHTHVLPRLAARGMTATFFLTAGFLERDRDVLAHLTRIWGPHPSPLAWEQVHEMRAAGMAFGSHTWSHRNLARLPSAELAEELTRSRAVLEDRLAEPVTAVAYPWGKLRRHVGEPTFAAAEQAGYRLGVISLPRAVRESDAPLRIPRLGVGAEPVERVAAKVGGEIDWHAAVHERLPGVLYRNDH